MQYTKDFINIKQKRRCPIIIRTYKRKYGRIGASYTENLGRRLEALRVDVANSVPDSSGFAEASQQAE